jgi:hypothetical protein
MVIFVVFCCKRADARSREGGEEAEGGGGGAGEEAICPADL